MILRKPYAFLIKKFRLIHFIIFGMLLYIFIRTIKVYSFFNDYAVNHFFTPVANMVDNYINGYIFIIIVLIFLLSAVVFYLLSIKKKSRKLYFFICLYYILMFIFFVYIKNIFIDLEDSVLSIESVRAIRDISLIALIPQIVLLFIVIARALGFNVKQFEFKKDLEDLQISAEDYEEVEVTLGKNNYKYARSFRKALRYTKYFFLENKFILTLFASIAVVGISAYFIIRGKVTNIVYHENQEVYINTLWYTVEGSYYTDKNINGVIINDNKYYILVKTKINNKSTNKYDLSSNLFKLQVNDTLVSPTFTFNQEFIDIGKIYTPMEIGSEAVEDVLVVFEINKEDLKNEYTFKVKANENTYISNDSSQFKNIIIKPTSIDSKEKPESYSIPSTIKFNDSNLGESKLDIYGFEIDSSFKEESNYCLNDNCYIKTIFIEPNKDNVIVRLSADLSLDENVRMKKYISSVADLFGYYGKIKYTFSGKTYETAISKVANKNINSNYTYLEVPNKVLRANEVEIYLNIREKTYIIILK